MKDFVIAIFAFVIVLFVGIKQIKKEQAYFNNIPILKGSCPCLETNITPLQCDSITTIAVSHQYDFPLAAALYFTKGFVVTMKYPGFESICNYDCQYEYMKKRIRLSREELRRIEIYIDKYKCSSIMNRNL